MGSRLVIRVSASSVSVPRCLICRRVIRPNEWAVLKAIVLKGDELEIEGYHYRCRQLRGSPQDESEKSKRKEAEK